jgi:predicted Zn-dependent protease
LLLAGYYHQALADRAAGRAGQAAELIAAAARRFPGDLEVQMLGAESLLIDQKNPQAAIDALTSIRLPDSERFTAFRRATLLADAYEAAGQKAEAAAALEPLLKAFPNPRLQQRVDALKADAGTR